jgi:hypothetical protein
MAAIGGGMRFFVCIALLVAIASEARADVFEPKMADICRPVPTPTTQGRIKPPLLLGRLLADPNVAVSFIDLNADGGTVTYEQMVNAVLAGSNYCNSQGSNCSKDPKVRDEVNKKLGRAQFLLIDYFQRHSSPVQPDEGGYQFTFERSGANIKAFFLGANDTLAPVCVVGKPAPGLPSPPVSEDKSRTGAGRLIIRNRVADLPISQTDAAFKGLQRASLSISSDQLKSSTTYNIQGVVGYGIGQSPIPNWSGAYAEIIPYLSYTRQFVNGNNPTKISDVDNVGAGVTGDLLFPAIGLQNYFPLTKGIYNDIQLSSQVVHSNRSNTDVLSGQLTYTPYINPLVVPGIATTERVGDFLVMLMPHAVFIYGDVLNAGNNAVLSQTGTFQRVGGHLEFSANADMGMLAGFGFLVSYDYLRCFCVGAVSQITLFTASLSYTIPKQEYWSIQLKYTDGRNLDTLEQQRLLTLGVGLKY